MKPWKVTIYEVVYQKEEKKGRFLMFFVDIPL